MALLILGGCASGSFSTGTAQLSRESVNKSIVSGRTTREQVRNLLGEPQSQSTSNFGGYTAETWTYNKMFYRDVTDKHSAGYAILRGFANPYATGYDRMEISMLSVTFDGSGRVKAHTFTTVASGAP